MSLDAVAPLPPGLGLGWNAEAEQRHTQALSRLERPLVSVSDTVRLPRELCLRHWMELEFQGEVPQCAGAAVTVSSTTAKSEQIAKIYRRMVTSDPRLGFERR